MSKIGQQPIPLQGTTVTVADGMITVQGTRGKLMQAAHPLVVVKTEGDAVVVSVKNSEDREQKALWGLYRALIANMVTGVREGFMKKLEVNGVGFRVEVKGQKLELALGFSHPVIFLIPDDVKITAEKNVLTIAGNDRQRVGQIAAEIRGLKVPEPYKGKGIKYSDEVVRRKAGKVVKA